MAGSVVSLRAWVGLVKFFGPSERFHTSMALRMARAVTFT